MEKQENVVYQRTGLKFVRHDARLFDKKLLVGKGSLLKYQADSEIQIQIVKNRGCE
ncbi:KfrB domain-containing protein [Nitrosomonas aestuarii]|uniref:KfrB domain-containing protein n=1 Tax=Nitrosomonas aestuarii TaxID=52441 RepID=UPI003CC81A8D